VLLRDLDNFRALLVLALATLGFALYVSVNSAPPPQHLQDLYGWIGYGAVIPEVVDYYWFWFETASFVVAFVTMFFFWRYGRHLLLVALAQTPLRIAFGGIWVSSPLENTFWALHGLFVILIAGMALFHPPVRMAFSQPINPSTPPNKSLERTHER